MNFVEYTFRVGWGDTDLAGIVFYPNFYKWMDEATHDFFSTIGFSTSKLFADEKIGLPLLEAKCQFKSPLLFEDCVSLRSSIAELHDKVFKIEHQFLKEEIVIASGYGIRAWTDFSSEKPKAVSIPQKVRDAISKTKINV